MLATLAMDMASHLNNPKEMLKIIMKGQRPR